MPQPQVWPRRQEVQQQTLTRLVTIKRVERTKEEIVTVVESLDILQEIAEIGE